MYPIKKLSEICNLQNGYAFKSGDYVEFSNTLNFRMSNIRPGGGFDLEYSKIYLHDNFAIKYKDFLLEEGDIVIAMTDMAKSPKILAIPTIIKKDNYNLLMNQRVGRFKDIDKEKLLISYFRWILLSPKIREKLVSMGGGGVQINISTKQILSLDIPLPPLSIQFCIVEKLDEAFGNIDKQIVLLKSNIDDVENLAKSILKKIFLEGELVAIEDLVCETKTWNPSIIGEEYFEYIDISSIDNVNYILTDTKTISGIDAPSRAKKLVNPNDIIFATTRPNLKNIAIVDKEIKNLTCSTGFCVLKANENKLFYRYLFYCLISDEMMVCIQPMIRGAQYPAISDKDLKSVQIPLPTLSRQFEIVSLLDALYDKNKQLKSEYEAQIQDLETLKQSLLEEAFAGRLVLDGQ